MRRSGIPWIVLAASLLLTVVATWAVADSVRARDQERFLNAVRSTRDRIETRLETYVALLRGGTGLFAATETPVSRTDFHEYVDRLDVPKRYPGIQGIGFTRQIAPDDQDSLAVAMQAQGFPDFRVWPDSVRSEYHAILYLEPLDRRNRAAIGYDMFTDSTRREAMARARDTGAPAMSGRVTLVQEIAGRKQAGFLIYVPVYGDGEVPETRAERRAALQGFVYAPFRADDLFAGIFGTEERPRLAFRIYDSTETEPDYLLHDSRTGGIAPVDSPNFTDTATLEIGGRTWTVALAETPFFEAGSRRSFVTSIALIGLMLSLVLFALSRAQVRAEEAARRSEEQFRTLADSIPQMAWMTRADGWIYWYNQRWYNYTGTTFERMEGWGWRSILHPDEADRVEAKFRHSIETGEPWEDTLPLRSKEGEYRWFLSRARPIRDDNGRIVRWFGTNTDITEQLHAREAEHRAIREQAAREAAEVREEHLRAYASELARSNRELQDFAYIASHDLQEPLRKISTLADLVIHDYGERLDENGRYYLHRVQDAALRMTRLIRDLLTYSRVASKAQPFEQVDLTEVIDDVLSDVEARLEETGGRVEVGKLCTIEADPTQMRQLLQNLIGNALKFHREGVPPVVEVAAFVDDESGSPENANQVCHLTVQDNGIGFEEKYVDKIFTPFQRLHGRDTYEGTGMGLAICRRIVERHGGTIRVESKPGEGSCFIVSLPVQQS